MRTKLANKPDEQKLALPAPTFLAEQDDTALVTAAESGSNEAFEVLVRRHQAGFCVLLGGSLVTLKTRKTLPNKPFKRHSYTCGSFREILFFPHG